MRRLPAPWLVLCFTLLSSCQCLVPVEEETEPQPADASLDASVDAGADAGAVDAGRSPDGGAECLTAADCHGTPWAPGSCFFGVPAGLSCVSQRCVSECVGDAGRTCVYDGASDCMTCGAEPPLCNADTCSTAAFTATVSSVECRPGVSAPISAGMTLSFVPLHEASCELSVSASSGGLGQVIRGAPALHFWFVRELGGWCVGEQLPTGAIRSRVACPACTFGIEGF